jgi:aminoglycoside phosphotransferase (APT) family kinase protein
MRAEVKNYRGPLRIEPFAGGQSNPTYKLITHEETFVLRRKPAGDLLPGAHAIEREYRVITALATQGFPVPKALALCADEDVTGTAFYVMAMVEGRIFWDSAIPGVNRSDRPAYADAMNATLARLHAFDPEAIGLGDYGRPGNYFARQISRWSRQYLSDAHAGRVLAMDRLIEWLPENIPPGDAPPRVIHGDYRCDNMIFHPTEPRVIAVLDWELSTLGHPLSDFSYHLMMYRIPHGMLGGMAGLDLAALNFPSEAEYVSAYCRRTGRDTIADLDFYLAFNLFRLAAIVHGIKGRLLRGNAASPQAAQMVENLEPLAELGWSTAQQAGA